MSDSLSSALQRFHQAVRSGGPDTVAGALVTSYHHYGEAFLREARRNRILFRIFSIDRGNAISEATRDRLNQSIEDSLVSHSEAGSVMQFLNEHRVIITPKIHLHDSLNTLSCWQIERNVALMELAAEIELQLRYQDRRLRKKLETTRFAPIEESQFLHSTDKSILENGTIVLRELLRRNPHRVVSSVTNGCEWNQVLTLADRWRAIQNIEDRYAYFDQRLFINDSGDFDLVVCRPCSFELEGALHFADYRSAYFDLVALQKAQPPIGQSEAELAERVHAAIGGGIRFDRLLERMEPEIETYVLNRRNGRRQAIEQSHLTVLAQTNQYEDTILPVLKAWDCLFRLSVLRKLVLDRIAEDRGLCIGNLVLVILKNRLIQYFQEFGRLDTDQASSVLTLLSFNPDENRIDEYDPYLQPLISLDTDQVLVLDPYVYNGRFARNAIKLLTQKGTIDLDECGSALERHFQRLLGDAGFMTNEDHRVLIEDLAGNQLADLDVVAYRDGVLVIGQAKAVIPPGNVYEIFRMIKRLEEAAAQLRICVDNLEGNREAIRGSLEIPNGEPLRVDTILPLILTNDITLTGYRIDGFLVFDPIALEDTLTQASPSPTLGMSLMEELESLPRMHGEHVNRLIYYEVNLASTVFLVMGTSLFPLIS